MHLYVYHLLKQAVIMAPVQADTTCCIGRMRNLGSIIVYLACVVWFAGVS